VYLQSQLLLTRSLSERPKVGANTRIDLAVAKLNPFGNWNATTIDGRQVLLADLARRAWDVIEGSPTVKPVEVAAKEPGLA
jgi:hypothetical protein